MVFGIRVSYSPSQDVSAKKHPGPPVCPCGVCYDTEEEHERARAACRSPARELATDPSSGLAGGGGSEHHRFGVSLGRRRGGREVDASSVASGRPLRAAAQSVPRTSGDVKSVV